MNLLDGVLLVPLLWGLYKGFVKGVIIELASILALLGGIYIAIHCCDYLSKRLKTSISFNQEYIPLLAFSILFIITVASVHLAAKLAERFAKSIALGGINKVLGALFGLFKLGFALSCIIGVLNVLDAKEFFITREAKQKSILLAPVSRIAPFVLPKIEQSEFAQKIWNSKEDRNSNRSEVKYQK